MACRTLKARQAGRVAHGRTGLSLVELLVVVGIISLLLAIAMPVTEKVKEQARSAVCFSNLRQVGFAANLYAEESNLCIPRGTGGPVWFQVFMPYLAQKPVDNDYRSVRIYRCPSYPDKRQTVCYVVNGWGFRDEYDVIGYETGEPTRLSECRRRSSSIYLADNEHGHWRQIITGATDEGITRCDVWHARHLPYSDMEDVMLGRRVARNRHKGGSNCLYLDWHVGWVDSDKMSIEMWRF